MHEERQPRYTKAGKLIEYVPNPNAATARDFFVHLEVRHDLRARLTGNSHALNSAATAQNT
jgi:hypothetical protein